MGRTTGIGSLDSGLVLYPMDRIRSSKRKTTKKPIVKERSEFPNNIILTCRLVSPNVDSIRVHTYTERTATVYFRFQAPKRATADVIIIYLKRVTLKIDV